MARRRLAARAGNSGLHDAEGIYGKGSIFSDFPLHPIDGIIMCPIARKRLPLPKCATWARAGCPSIAGLQVLAT